MPTFIIERGTDYCLCDGDGRVLYQHYDPEIFLAHCECDLSIKRDSLINMWLTRSHQFALPL